MRTKPEDLGKEPLPNDKLVYFYNCGDLQDGMYGRIKGIAQTPQPYVGYNYIIELDTKLSTYEYSSICVFEIWIDPRKSTIGEILEDLENNSTQL